MRLGNGIRKWGVMHDLAHSDIKERTAASGEGYVTAAFRNAVEHHVVFFGVRALAPGALRLLPSRAVWSY